MPRHATVAALVVTLLAIGGCGSDDPPSASKATTTVEQATTTESAEVPPEFCEAKAAFDAVDSDTPDEAAFDRYVGEATAKAEAIADAAPANLADAATTLVKVLQGLETLDDGTAAHANAAYAKARGELATAVHEGCGYGRLELTIEGNGYAEPLTDSKAGPASLLVDNRDGQVHVTIVAKLTKGVTGQQLLENPDLFETSATLAGVVVAGPDSVDGTVLDLSAGEYVYFDPEHMEDGMAASLIVSA